MLVEEFMMQKRGLEIVVLGLAVGVSGLDSWFEIPRFRNKGLGFRV